MANRRQPPVAVTEYAKKYKEMVVEQAGEYPAGDDVLQYEQIRSLAFAMADPTCLLHWFIKEEAPPSHEYVADNLLTLNKSQVARALYRASGVLGLYEPSGARKNSASIECVPALPSEAEFSDINSMREKLEIETFLALHSEPDDAKREAGLDRLEESNAKIKKVERKTNTLLRSVNEQGPLSLADGLYTEPVIGYQAEVFWEHDRDFHMAAAEAVGMKLHAKMLCILLERIRLSGSDRAVILERVPVSYDEHNEIIGAVTSGTSKQVEEAVSKHFQSSNQTFGFG